MTTKFDIISAIKAAADAYYAADPDTGGPLAIALGTPGAEVEIAGQKFDTGKAWLDEPKSIPTQIEGLADFLDTKGISNINVVVAKVDEVIASLNQLIDDYNGGKVPTAAPKVDPIMPS